jgi:hypothetical protein
MVQMSTTKTQTMEDSLRLFSCIFHIRPKVVEPSFYHHAHTRVNGKLTHAQHDPKSMAHMSQYVPQMFEALKDYIWTQLSFGHTIK